MPNARIGNTTANARIGYQKPNIMVQSFQTGILTPETTTSGITIGTPIGLLLALTYAASMGGTTPAVYRGDLRPNVRITST